MKAYVGRNKQNFVIPEETLIHPENSLHPADQIELVTKWKEHTSLSMFTNSPYMLNGLSFSEVFIVNKGVVKALSEHPEAEYWEGNMTAAEF